MKKRRNSSKRNRVLILFLILTILGIGTISVIFIKYEPNRYSNWSGIRKEIKDSLKGAELSGTASKWIIKNATKSELIKLTEYPNGIIKAIAYEGLLRRKDFTEKAELTLRAINDTFYIIDYQSRCIRNVNIGEYLVQNVLLIDDEIAVPEILPDFGLKETEIKRILHEFKKVR